jgi:hypothetical protein
MHLGNPHHFLAINACNRHIHQHRFEAIVFETRVLGKQEEDNNNIPMIAPRSRGKIDENIMMFFIRP